MTRNVTLHGSLLALFMAAVSTVGGQAMAADVSPSQQAIDAAAENTQFAFIMFYRTNDAATQSMHQVVQQTLSSRNDATIVPVQISDAKEAALVEQFDASRMPMPAVAVLAPNGAVTGVLPQRVTAQQLTAMIVSSGQAECLKALQDRKIVLLCVQPDGSRTIPNGVREFHADELYKDRSQIVNIVANDPEEQAFLRQLKIRTDQSTTVTAFMAPPGVMLGTYNANVTHAILAQKLAAAGKCCDDPNCKHHQNASGNSSTSR